ncbi:hypothetical protein ACTNEO_20130 [Gracilibacillus sp. HCP3S3_G5_1]|uniref:hypothetical protein n=1 Tax=unclassified Gracilibacillus TaxID=2625209 RepID=UPI003F8B2856
MKTVLKTQMLLQFKLEDILETPNVPTPFVPTPQPIQNIVTATGFVNGESLTATAIAYHTPSS